MISNQAATDMRQAMRGQRLHLPSDQLLEDLRFDALEREWVALQSEEESRAAVWLVELGCRIAEQEPVEIYAPASWSAILYHEWYS